MQKLGRISRAAVVVLTLLSSAALFWGQAALARVTTEAFQITTVIDGDTVHGLDAQGKKIKVRMQGMDAPELHLMTEHGTFAQLPWAVASGHALENLVRLGERIELRVFGKDKYGRTLGQIVVRGMNVNLELVRQGAAISYSICPAGHCTEEMVREQQVHEFAEACRQAESRGIGVFDPREPLDEMPFEFRLRIQGRKADKFVGSLTTGEYVSPDRYREIPVCDRIFFLSEQDAAQLGFRLRK
jgi:endonuclease YncB( thermonuclease family)